MTLKDLPEGWKTADDAFIHVLKIALGTPTDGPLRVYRGVYLAHINFDKEIRDLIVDHYPMEAPSIELDRWCEYMDVSFGTYGVVDHWSQLPLRALDADERNLLVFLGRHAKADQSERGGWRWHKWGPYLGVFQEQVAENEYLYDTPDVVEVWSYQIVEIR